MATKDKLFKKESGEKSYVIDASEFGLARDLNTALQMHVYRQRLMSGYLTVLTKHHLPDYKLAKGVGLEFSLDLSEESDYTVTVKEVPLKEE